VALVAAIAVGIYAAATWLGDDEYIVVIDDDPMRPSGVTAAGPTTTAAATETTAAPATTTAAGAFYDPEPFELDLGRRSLNSRRLGPPSPSAGLTARAGAGPSVALDNSGDGVLRGLSLLVTAATPSPRRECDAMEGKKGEDQSPP
jgi:hypothetical protein